MAKIKGPKKEQLNKNNKNKWENGKESETGFWNQWFKTKGLQWQDDYKTRFSKNRLIQDDLVELIDTTQEEIKILDVGSGPATSLGTFLPNHKHVTLIAVDPLAKVYQTLYKKYNQYPATQTQYGEVEHLSGQFHKNSFDLIHMGNALDHSYNPILGIQEMLKVLKPNCYIFLQHNINEAENEHYEGFHQWNFVIIKGDFVIWNKEEKYNVTEIFKKKADITCKMSHNWITVYIKKIKSHHFRF